jgi:hypothetical protein
VAMGAALVVVVALGALHSRPADGAAGLRATGQPRALTCGMGCAAPFGSACAQLGGSTALYEKHNTNECQAVYMR